MKDFIREYGRIGGLTAASAFVLSLLVGLLSRNAFLTALVRAAAISVVFGGLGGGVRYILKKFLIDLGADERQQASEGADEQQRGGRINIVLPEENPLEMSASEDDAEQPEEAEAEMRGVPRRASAEAGADAEGPGQGAARPDAEIAELFGEEDDNEPPSEAAAPERLVESETSSEAYEEPLPDIERLASNRPGVSEGGSTEEGRPATRRKAREAAGAEAGSFVGAAVTRAGSGLAARPGSRERPAEALKARVSGEDPQTIAKAIRTVLKRDERG